MEGTGSSTDARVRYLEQVTQQLNEQVRVMKQLVTTEVSDLKIVMQQQVAEIKQIVMHQDRVYQERIRRLEARVEQLSEFSMQLARTTGATGATTAAGGYGVQHHPSHALGVASESPRRAASPAKDDGQDDDHDDDDGLDGMERVMAKYSEKLSTVYDFYTQSNIQVFHPTMTLPHFTKLCKDCHLCGFEKAQPVELLWMTIMRKLGKRRHRRAARRNSSLMSGKFDAPKSRGVENFAFERLDDIPRESFGDAMSILAMQRLGTQRADLPPEHIFETFLVCDLFPNVDRVMAQQQTHTAMLARDVTGAASIHEYKTPEVHAIVKEYMARLRDSFAQCIHAAQDYRDTAMTLDGFVEFVRRHEVMPLISKPDIRQIFLACAAIEKQNNKDAPPDTISMKAFVLCIYHLADRIYGDALYADKYPTPAARVQKLLAKIYLLR